MAKSPIRSMAWIHLNQGQQRPLGLRNVRYQENFFIKNTGFINGYNTNNTK